MKQTVPIVLVLAWAMTSVGLAAEGIWTKKADMPTARGMHSGCVADGKIYIVRLADETLIGQSTSRTVQTLISAAMGLAPSLVSMKITCIEESPSHRTVVVVRQGIVNERGATLRR